MSKIRFSLVLTFAMLVSTSMFAQATRTWVSGVGDDVNPCSRTAPCKTFAGAISKTAVNGIIDVLDQGAFGAVTITKAITIDGTGQLASVLASGTNGIVINAPTNATVVLRNLDIEGTGGASTPGIRGVKIIQAGTVIIENCVITGFSDRAVSVEVSSAVKVLITNSQIRANGGSGISFQPAAGAPSMTATISNTTIANNASSYGIYAAGGSRITVSDSTISGNSTGVRTNGTAGPASVTIVRSTITNNGTGLTAWGGTGIQMTLDQVSLHDNPTAGFNIVTVSPTPPPQIQTFQDNYVSGNGPNVGSLTQNLKM